MKIFDDMYEIDKIRLGLDASQLLDGIIDKYLPGVFHLKSLIDPFTEGNLLYTIVPIGIDSDEDAESYYIQFDYRQSNLKVDVSRSYVYAQTDNDAQKVTMLFNAHISVINNTELLDALKKAIDDYYNRWLNLTNKELMNFADVIHNFNVEACRKFAQRYKGKNLNIN